jgi:hypothetical protein
MPNACSVKQGSNSRNADDSPWQPVKSRLRDACKTVEKIHGFGGLGRLLDASKVVTPHGEDMTNLTSVP